MFIEVQYNVCLEHKCAKCQPMTKGHNLHSDYLSVTLFFMGKRHALKTFVLQAVNLSMYDTTPNN